jgi:NitT/TauT family transport system ATP-binding protein
MKQRVSLARAWVADPDTLLMDEPFGALDEQTRVTLQNELLRLWDRAGLFEMSDFYKKSDILGAAGGLSASARRKTVLFVTHSIDEALVLADRILVMSPAPGRVVAEVRVPFARPRDAIQLRREPQFGELAFHIWQALRVTTD